MIHLVIAMLIGDDWQVMARSSLARSEAKAALAAAEKALVKVEKTDPLTDYHNAKLEAVKRGKPIVLFIGCKLRPIPGALAYRFDSLPVSGLPKLGIVIGRPLGEGLEWVASLVEDASDDDILYYTRPKLP